MKNSLDDKQEKDTRLQVLQETGILQERAQSHRQELQQQQQHHTTQASSHVAARSTAVVPRRREQGDSSEVEESPMISEEALIDAHRRAQALQETLPEILEGVDGEIDHEKLRLLPPDPVVASPTALSPQYSSPCATMVEDVAVRKQVLQRTVPEVFDEVSSSGHLLSSVAGTDPAQPKNHGQQEQQETQQEPSFLTAVACAHVGTSQPGAFPIRGYAARDSSDDEDDAAFSNSSNDEPTENTDENGDVVLEATVYENQEGPRESIPVQAEPWTAKRIWQRRGVQVSTCLVVVVMLALAVGLSISQLEGETIFIRSTQAPTPQPTAAPTAAPTRRVPALELLTTALPEYSLQALNQTDSYQSRALAWLSADPDYERLGRRRLVQRFALASLYFSTNGDGWTRNEGFLSYSNEYEWSLGLNTGGPVCNDDGAYRYLHGPGNNLNGTIPLEIALLSSLEYLELSSNSLLTGPIPGTIGELSKLTALILSTSFLTSTIPQGLFRLQKLVELVLNNNRISGSLPSELAAMTQIRVVNLRRNEFESTLPPELSSLTALEELSLGSNQLQGTFPVSLGALTSLQTLNLEVNGMSGGFDSYLISNWTQITYFGVNDNLNFGGTLSSTFGSLTRLTTLNVRNNRFTGSIPTELARLTNLNLINLSQNSLGPPPAELCDAAVSLNFDLIADVSC